MKNKIDKSLFALIALLVILGIIYFLYPQKNKSDVNTTPANKTTTEEVKLSYLPDQVILKTLQGIPDGKGVSATKVVQENNGCFFEPESEMGTFGLCDVARGDLNKDGYIDAVGIYTSCGASCSTRIAAIINNKDGTGILHFLNTDSIVTSGAGQTGLYRVYVIDGNIAVLGSGFKIKNSQENSIKYIKYNVNGDDLVIIDSK